MRVDVQVRYKGSSLLRVSEDHKNSLTVNLLDWWDVLTGKLNVEYFPPNALEMVGGYSNTFSHHPENIQFPMYDREEADDFYNNMKHLKELGYKPSVLKGRDKHNVKSWRIYVDGFKGMSEY